MEKKISIYGSAYEWRRADRTKYLSAKSKGLLPEICKMFGWELPTKFYKPNGHWNKENCIAEGKKYNSLKEWREKSISILSIVYKNGWVDECTAHMIKTRVPHKYWDNKENCLAEARKYSTRTEWGRNSSGAINSAKKYGWYEECIAHMVDDKFILTKEYCIEEAKKYKLKQEWKEKDGSTFYVAKHNGWYDECTAHMVEYRKPPDYWTKENVITEAKKYNTITEWRANSSGSYAAAKRNKWTKEALRYIKKNREIMCWTKENCLVEAQNYNVKSNWGKYSCKSYQVALKNGWMDECTAHMVTRVPYGYWQIKENCLAEARKYSTRVEWVNKSGSSYQCAKKYGWLEECLIIMNNGEKNK